MEIINGSSSWRLKIKRFGDHIALLRAFTCDTRAALPDTLFSLPITVIGDHCFAFGSRDVPGEDIEIRCGIPCGDFDNSALTELKLPAYISTIENYAFLNCRKLETLILTDRVRSFGCEMFMNCRSLSNIKPDMPGDAAGLALPALAGSLAGRLIYTLQPHGRPAYSFVLPEYFEDYEENAPNHDFTLHVTGGGVAYRMCFTKSGEPDFKAYDALWKSYISKYHEPETALLLAWNRLRSPEQLEDDAREAYTQYLLSRSGELFAMLLRSNDMEGLRLFAACAEGDAGILSNALELARSMKRTEAVAFLLEKQHRSSPAADFSFDL